MSLPHYIGKFAAPESISAEKTYEWLKSDGIEMTIHYDDGSLMMVGQHIRLEMGNKLYVCQITSAEWRPIGDGGSAADLTLKVMTVEDVID